MGNCRLPHCKTSFGQSSFPIKGVNIWNSLPTKLKAIHSHGRFRSKMKEFLKDNQVCGHIQGNVGVFKEWLCVCACVCLGGTGL